MQTTTSPGKAIDSAPAAMGCTWTGFRRGVRQMTPLSVGTFAWGIAFGVIAGRASWSLLDALFMSLTVFSGTAQIVALEMARDNAGMLPILGVTLLVSLRYILMGMTMNGWFARTPRWLFWPGIHYTGDQSWAMNLNEIRSGRCDTGYFLGANAAGAAAWLLGTGVGVTAGGWLSAHIGGLQFAATAALVGVLGEMGCRRREVLPWLVTGIAVVLVNRLLGGYWHLMAGVVCGVGVLLIQEATHDPHH